METSILSILFYQDDPSPPQSVTSFIFSKFGPLQKAVRLSLVRLALLTWPDLTWLANGAMFLLWWNMTEGGGGSEKSKISMTSFMNGSGQFIKILSGHSPPPPPLAHTHTRWKRRKRWKSLCIGRGMCLSRGMCITLCSCRNNARFGITPFWECLFGKYTWCRWCASFYEYVIRITSFWMIPYFHLLKILYNYNLYSYRHNT